MPGSENKEILLDVRGLTQRFGKNKGEVTVVHNVGFQVNYGEIYGLVGESGSGKSTIGKCIIGLNKPSEGEILFEGKELKEGSRDGIQMIFQDPMSSLNPRRKIGDIIASGLEIKKSPASIEERKKMVGDMMEKVGLSRELAGRYPSQFSGGQRQRVGIARALIMQPKLVIADECIAALDASVQAQVVNMLKSIQKETGTAFIFISHDLSMVRYLSDRIGVLHMGYLLETGTTDEIYNDPIHPYTRNLLRAIPGSNPLMHVAAGERYDYDTSGIVYENGTWHYVGNGDSHKVLCTDAEAKKWGIQV
ncbi:MAG: ATP-binding cassette domain-containing protein [Lachnospiraceae bacterium]|nr:ATP-binding cassette domain-containing protein [Lachnospiraceae bacterium]